MGNLIAPEAACLEYPHCCRPCLPQQHSLREPHDILVNGSQGGAILPAFTRWRIPQNRGHANLLSGIFTDGSNRRDPDAVRPLDTMPIGGVFVGPDARRKLPR